MIMIYIDTSQEILRWALCHRLRLPADRPSLPTTTTTRLSTSIAVVESAEHATVTLIDVDTAPLSTKQEQFMTTPCIGFGLRSEPMFAARVVSLGALGYVGLSAKPDDLIATIVAAASGNRVLSPDVLALIEDANNPHLLLTPREREVMDALVVGSTCQEIGERLSISTKTIDTHRGHVLKKLRLRNAAELVKFAVRYGYTALVP